MFAPIRGRLSVLALLLSIICIAGLALVAPEVARDQLAAHAAANDKRSGPAAVKSHEPLLSGPSSLLAGSQTAIRCTVQSVKSLTETTTLPADVIVRLRAANDK